MTQTGLTSEKESSMTAITRSLGTNINWGRMAIIGLAILASMLALVEPAYAFGDFANKVEGKTTEAWGAAQTILYAAAVLALIIGIAPMLWGQVKVKWIVSCLCAAILFAFIPSLISGIK